MYYHHCLLCVWTVTDKRKNHVAREKQGKINTVVSLQQQITILRQSMVRDRPLVPVLKAMLEAAVSKEIHIEPAGMLLMSQMVQRDLGNKHALAVKELELQHAIVILGACVWFLKLLQIILYQYLIGKWVNCSALHPLLRFVFTISRLWRLTSLRESCLLTLSHSDWDRVNSLGIVTARLFTLSEECDHW